MESKKHESYEMNLRNYQLSKNSVLEERSSRACYRHHHHICSTEETFILKNNLEEMFPRYNTILCYMSVPAVKGLYDVHKYILQVQWCKRPKCVHNSFLI